MLGQELGVETTTAGEIEEGRLALVKVVVRKDGFRSAFGEVDGEVADYPTPLV